MNTADGSTGLSDPITAQADGPKNVQAWLGNFTGDLEAPLGVSASKKNRLIAS